MTSEKTSPFVPEQCTDPQQVALYVKDLALELSRISENAGLMGLAACLRGAVVEGRRITIAGALLKLGS